MVYLNAGEISNSFATRRRDRTQTLLAREASALAHVTLAFCFMMVIAAALLIHGIVLGLSSAIRGVGRVPVKRRHARARYVPAYPTSLS